MAIFKEIKERYNNLEDGDELYPFYELLYKKVKGKEEDEIVEVLNKVKTNYNHLITENEEEGKSTTLYEKAIKEINSLMLYKEDDEEEEEEEYEEEDEEDDLGEYYRNHPTYGARANMRDYEAIEREINEKNVNWHSFLNTMYLF